MRMRYLTFLFLLLAGFSCNRSNVIIKGKVEGGDEQVIYLERLDVNRTTFIDSARIGKGGSFTLTANLEEPELFVLRYSKGGLVNLLIYPGETINLSTSDEAFGKGYSIEGSEESANIRVLVEKLNSTRSQLDSLQEIAATIGDPDSPQMQAIHDAYTQAIVNQKRFNILFLVEHMSSLSSVYALYQKYDEETMVMGLQSDLPYFKVLADSLELIYPNSSLTTSLRADIRRREIEYTQASQLNTLLEMANEPIGLLDLSISDREGREITLAEYNGKVILVLFWASENEASVNTLLQLKSTYELYHQKGFEIYAISMDNNKFRWMNAIDYNEFDWINVSELSYPDSRAALLYNVNSLPAAYLINREGDIVAKNLFGRTLETWLDNLL